MCESDNYNVQQEGKHEVIKEGMKIINMWRRGRRKWKFVCVCVCVFEEYVWAFMTTSLKQADIWEGVNTFEKQGNHKSKNIA